MTTPRSIRSRKWLNSPSSLLLASFLAATGCREEGEQGPYCEWVEEEVPLDYSLGPWGGYLDYDLQPGKVLEQLTVPLQGTLTWNGGGDWAEITPSEGMTGFTSTLSYGDRVIYRRVPGTEGNDELACLATLEFDAVITMTTDDGVLEETWETVASFVIATASVTVELDAQAVGLIGKLAITPNPTPPTPFDNVSYWLPLFYDVYPLSPEQPTTVSGSLYMRGEFEVEQPDDEVMELAGVNRLLVEWAGMEGD